MAHMTSEFRFEKYKTAEDAKVVLLKLHPVGSSVDELVETLDKAGGEEYIPFIEGKYKKNPRLKNIVYFRYYSGFLELIRWGVSVERYKENKIFNIGVSKMYEGF
jgi:hypothetical protein